MLAAILFISVWAVPAMPKSASADTPVWWDESKQLSVTVEGNHSLKLRWSGLNTTVAEAVYYTIYENDTLVGQTESGAAIEYTLPYPSDAGMMEYRVEAVGSDGAESTNGPAETADMSPFPHFTAALETIVRNMIELEEGDALTFAHVASLTYVNLQDRNLSTADLLGLEYAINMDALLIGGNPDILDLPDLTGLSRLQNFSAYGTGIAEAALDKLPSSLTTLNIGRTAIRNMSDVAATVIRTNVGSLTIDGLDVDDAEFAAMFTAIAADRTSLGSIQMTDNRISDISVLEPFINLYSITASQNQIESIDVLSHLPNLIDVRLDRNQIQDISVLLDLPQLHTIHIQENPRLDMWHESEDVAVILQLNPSFSFQHDPIVYPDTSAPTWITADLYNTGLTSTGVYLNWSAAADPSGISYYRIYMNGSQVGEVDGNTTAHWVSGIDSRTTYEFKVEAGDAQGNWSENGPTWTLTPDTTPPDWMGAPPGMTATAVDPATVRLTWYGSPWDDRVDVSGYEIFMNDVSIAVVDLDTSEYSVSDLDVENQTYRFALKALDAAGNRSVNGPTTSVAPDREGPTWWWNASMEYSYPGAASIRLTWYGAEDPSGIANYKIFRDGVEYGTVGNVTEYVVEGINTAYAYTFKVEAQDGKGNWSGTGPSVATTPDLAPPTWLSYERLQAKEVTDSGMKLEWPAAYDAASGVAEYRVYRDGTPIATLPSQFTSYVVEDLATDGKYVFEVEAIDVLGNGVPREQRLKGTFIARTPIAVTIPDPVLEEQLRYALGLSAGGPITDADLRNIRSLHLSYSGITNLEGIQHAINLKEVDLSNTSIPDRTPLQALENLERLTYRYSDLTSIAWMSGFVHLKALDLQGNRIQDISALSGMTNLTNLVLWDNEIVDIAPLASMKKLNSLDLDGNRVQDISVLQTLYENGAFAGEGSIYLSGNPLDLSPGSEARTVIEYLKSKEVQVSHDDFPPGPMDAELHLDVSKGIAMDGETVVVTISKRSDQDMTAFEFPILFDFRDWVPIGYAVSPDIAGEMAVDAWLGFPAAIFEGTLREGGAPIEGAAELVKVYFRAGASGEGDGEWEPPYEGLGLPGGQREGLEGFPGGSEEYPLDEFSFGLTGGSVTDSEGIVHYNGMPVAAFVPAANPDADRNGDVNEDDVQAIAALFGKREEEVEPSAFVDYDMNRNGIIDMNDITFVYMRWKQEGADPDAPPPDLRDFEFMEVPG